MKILHLIEDLVGTVKTQKNFNGTLGRTDTNYNTKRKALGTGHFSSVKDHPHDPHLVKKHSKRVEEPMDGYNVFIEYIINHNLTDNIHFPKIYNVTAIKDKHGNKIHTYTIEKLIPFKEASDDELEFFMHKTFSEETNKHILQDMARNHSKLSFAIAMVINEFAYSDRPIEQINDDSFREAIETLKRIEKNVTFAGLDVKMDNIMWRRTPHGLVLVFTDPIS